MYSILELSCHLIWALRSMSHSLVQPVFFRLRQIRRVRQSLDAESAATLVHAFVTSRVDYCNAVLAGSPKVTTDKLQHVMNSAGRVVFNTRKFDSGLPCRGYCTTNSAGSMLPNEYNSSLLCWCADVSMEQRCCTWWTVEHKQPTSLVINICGLPVSGRWSLHGIEWTAMVVGVLLLRARRPVIRCQTVFVTWPSSES